MKEIVKSYVLGSFWLDFVATFPFDVVLQEFNIESNKGQKLARFIQIPRMSRLAKVFRLVKMSKVAKFGR